MRAPLIKIFLLLAGVTEGIVLLAFAIDFATIVLSCANVGIKHKGAEVKKVHSEKSFHLFYQVLFFPFFILILQHQITLTAIN